MPTARCNWRLFFLFFKWLVNFCQAAQLLVSEGIQTHRIRELHKRS